MKIKVAIVDDKQINRQTVIGKLYGHSDIELILEAKDGRDFLEQCKSANP